MVAVGLGQDVRRPRLRSWEVKRQGSGGANEVRTHDHRRSAVHVEGLQHGDIRLPVDTAQSGVDPDELRSVARACLDH